MLRVHVWQPHPSHKNYPKWYALPIQKPVLIDNIATWEMQDSLIFDTQEQAEAIYKDRDYIGKEIEALLLHIEHLDKVLEHVNKISNQIDGLVDLDVKAIKIRKYLTIRQISEVEEKIKSLNALLVE